MSIGNEFVTASGSEFLVNSTISGGQDESAVTALTGGGFVVVWDSAATDSVDWDVYGQMYDADGNTVGDEFQINTYTSDGQYLAKITALDDGGFVVVWESEEQDADVNGIYGQRYDADGVVVGEEFQINTDNTYEKWYTSIASLADGGFAVVWQSEGQDGDGWGIYGQMYDADSNTVGDEFLINTETGGYQLKSSITGLNDGGFVVMWASAGQDSEGWGTYGQMYDADGNKVGDEFQTSTDNGANNQGIPVVTALASGGFVVAWEFYGTGDDDNDLGIFGRVYDADGTAIGDEFKINTYSDSAQQHQDITALDDGGFVVVWQSDAQDGDGTGIYGQRYDLNGDMIGDEFLVNTYTSGDQFSTSISTLADGSIVVTWTSADGQDGDGYGVYSQIFDIADVGMPTDDILIGSSGEDVIMGGDGDDSLYGKGGDDEIYGGRGSDYIEGNGGKDILYGRSGQDIIKGGNGDDYIKGGGGADELRGNAGKDKLFGGKGDDYIKGGKEIDKLRGGAGNDELHGGADNDVLRGGEGDDILFGGKGNDVLRGGNDDDTLYGGKGDDKLTGGDGDDVFVFLGNNLGTDTVTDFEDGTDILQLFEQNGDFDSLTITDSGDDLEIIYDSGTIILEGLAGTILTADDFDFAVV